MKLLLLGLLLGCFGSELVWCDRRLPKFNIHPKVLPNLGDASNPWLPIPEPNVTEKLNEKLRARFLPSSEQRLINHLHTKLTKYSVPRIKWKPYGIQLYFKFKQIVDVSEKDGVWQARFYFEAIYQSKATWSPAQFGKISDVTVPAKMFWHPPIVVEEITETRFNLHATKQQIMSDGKISTYRQMVVAKMLCSFDVSYFPFDEQICNMTFVPVASTTNNNSLSEFFKGNSSLNCVFNKAEMSEHDQWKLLVGPSNESCQRNGKSYTVTVHMRRRPLYYTLVLLIPSVVIYVLSSICFMLPSDTCEKVSFSVTILLAEVVAFSSLREILPANSQNSPILLYLLTAILLHMGLLCMISSIVVNISQSGWRLSMSRKLQRFISSPRLKLFGLDPLDVQERYRHFRLEQGNMFELLRKAVHSAKDPNQEEKREENRMKEQEINDIRWRFLANVIDRILLIIHLIVMISVLAFFHIRFAIALNIYTSDSE